MRSAVSLLVLCLVMSPGAGYACPVCFTAANERVLHSYYGTAVVLTLLPLLIVGGFVVWLARRSRAE